jgi:DNA relaxase NicK
MLFLNSQGGSYAVAGTGKGSKAFYRVYNVFNTLATESTWLRFDSRLGAACQMVVTS